jgi:hypothetical protein
MTENTKLLVGCGRDNQTIVAVITFRLVQKSYNNQLRHYSDII